MKENMFYGAGNLIFEKAKELRNRMTPAEELLWKQIHINEWKVKFRRQHPIANYVVDFYCHEKKLVIELDGEIHNVEEVKVYDSNREEHLEELGLTVLRFKNEQIFKENKSVLETIANTINGIITPVPDRGKLYIIKIGGNVIDDEKILNKFLAEFAQLFGSNSNQPFRGRGLLVHGGGKIATAIGDKLGIQSKYIDGRRITDDETIDLVTMVYGGLVNKKIVATLQSLQCNAIGLSGADANVLPAKKRPLKTLSTEERLGEVIDYGWVGDVNATAIEASAWQLFIDNNLIPVVAPLTHDGKGNMLNTNADTMASVLSVSLSKMYNVQLIYCFEKNGVLTDINDERSNITELGHELYNKLKEEKKLFAGILPKIDNAFDAVNSGVNKVVIGNSIDLLQLVNGGKGTKIIL
ncbi:MAG: acetylglutamate kinase [Ginsengibacter sp.]